MSKVTIIGRSMIYVGNEHVGDITGRGEVYVSVKNALGQEQTIARFKYHCAKASAIHWVKFIFSKLTVKEILEKLNVYPETPIGLAEKYGYVPYNILKMKKAGLIK